MSMAVDLSQEAFDKLLAWLDPDREEAGRKYEVIRSRLIKIFICRGCREAEELADETFNRVMSKIETISESYTGDPALFFYGVARNIYLEHLKRERVRPAGLPPQREPGEDLERMHDCLDQCLRRLGPDRRELIVHYYDGEKGVRIEGRRLLAERLGLAVNALRIRAHRIRAELQKCVEGCLGAAG
jgi:RNA polymerase sigma factor (sigma-70 family)